MTRPIRLAAAALAGTVAVAGPAAGQDEAQTLTGGLVACYVGQDLTNDEHVACANLCMELAVPLVLAAEDGHVYVPTGVDDDRLARHLNDELVEIRGAVGEQAECRTIAVAGMKEGSPPQLATRTGKAYTARMITDKDLAELPDMSVYYLLRQHALVRIESIPGYGESLLCEEREVVGEIRGCYLYVNERRAHDPMATLRDMSIREVGRLEILRRSDASNRYGGHGMNGAVTIRTKK